MKAYCEQEGLPVCDDLDKMVLEENDQYPNGFVPKGETDKLSHVQPAFLSFGVKMDGTGLDGIRDGACLALCYGCALLFVSGHVFDITGCVCRFDHGDAHEDGRGEAQCTERLASVLPGTRGN